MIDDKLVSHAEALIDALPFLQQLKGHQILVKIGGSVMEKENLVEKLISDIVLLHTLEIHPVIVHGGGMTISEQMRLAGLKPKFFNGLRITDQETIAVVENALDNIVQPQIIQAIEALGAKSAGISGKSVFKATKLHISGEAGQEAPDLGFVGKVTQVNTSKISWAFGEGRIPIVSPLATNEASQVMNVNADLAAGALAGELGVIKCAYISDVPGIMRNLNDKDSLISSISLGMIEKLVQDGIIHGGMLPKVQSAKDALERGVKKVHFIDGRVTHALILEMLSSGGLGTQIAL